MGLSFFSVSISVLIVGLTLAVIVLLAKLSRSERLRGESSPEPASVVSESRASELLLESPESSIDTPQMRQVRADAIRFESLSNRKGQIYLQRGSEEVLNARRWRTREVSRDVDTLLSPLLKEAVRLIPVEALLDSIAGARTYHVVLKGAGDLLRSKNGDFMPILVDHKTHRFTEIGRIVHTGSLTPALFWELSARATAQKFLIDIDKKLASIESGIQRLESSLRNREIATLQTHWRELQTLSGSMKTSPSFLGSLEIHQHSLRDARIAGVRVARAIILRFAVC